MATVIANLIPIIRNRLVEPTARFWTDDELTEMVISGIRDLWRDVVDLKQEHYLTINNTDVFLAPNSSQLSGVPVDVHIVYMIEPQDVTEQSPTEGLLFQPREYNNDSFISARTRPPIDPSNDVIYYDIHSQGAPVGAPIIRVAPQVTSTVYLSFGYVPTLSALTEQSVVPIPGEADNALIAWTVAYARSKERDDRSPDPAWLNIYGTEKAHLLNSLGLREYQEPKYVDAIWSQYW
jgi:hypothetical protein